MKLREERSGIDTRFAIVLCGCMTDLKTTKNIGNPLEIKTANSIYKDIHEMCREYKIPFIETSAFDDENVELLIRTCVLEYWFQCNVPLEKRFCE